MSEWFGRRIGNGWHLSAINAPQDLIYAVEDCEPLVDHFRSLAWEEHDEIQCVLDEND